MTRQIKKIRPWMVLIAYAFAILTFALAYFIFDSIKPEGFLNALYFSVVTITTLGYGDIAPQEALGKSLVCVEALFGIIVIGLFLNSLWHSFTDKLRKEQEIEFEKRRTKNETARLRNYLRYFSNILSDYTLYMSTITTPIDKRLGEPTINNDFVFSDMQHMYLPSMLTGKNSFTAPSIKTYYQRQQELKSDFKFILSNFDLDQHKIIHNSIIQLLNNFNMFDVREELLNHLSTPFGEKMKSDYLVSFIRQHEKCPDIKEHQHTILRPAIGLFLSLKAQIPLINALTSEVDALLKSN